jgi:hypothetical protein
LHVDGFETQRGITLRVRRGGGQGDREDPT